MGYGNNELGTFRNNEFGLFPRMFSTFENIWENLNLNSFKVDVRENNGDYLIDAEMPGVKKEDISIDVSDNLLTISANLDECSTETDNTGRYLRKERRSGAFRRSFSLDNIKADQISAEMHDGILTIHCPKMNETLVNARRIEIQ